LQWKLVTQTYERLRYGMEPDRFYQLRYEDFINDPRSCLAKLSRFCGLPHDHDSIGRLVADLKVIDANKKWRAELSDVEKARLTDAIKDRLRFYGYEK
jgi:hypothetical protein